MEQNLVSDEELLHRINKVLNEAKPNRRQHGAEVRQEEASGEKFHDVNETTEQVSAENQSSEVKVFGAEKNLVLENHYLSLQLQAEKKKTKDLQSKFKLFENSVKYFERLNGQLETIKRAVEEDVLDFERNPDKLTAEAMQKLRPKTVHTAASAVTMTTGSEALKEATHCSEPHDKGIQEKEEVAFRDAEDFKQLEEGLEIVKDKNVDADVEAEKVYITKMEKRCLEDIGNIASRTRPPMDYKHQRYFERDRRKFANSIVMPEIQEVEKTDVVPPEIITKTKETPVNITSTELDGLRSYLLQLKELIARRETAWARTTERDYNQRVEITKFKNEVSHLRMLCEKRQKDIKERDQIIASKEEEIRYLQKRIQGLRNPIMKLEKKDDRLIDTIDGMAGEVLENSQMVQRSYNAMKRQSLMNRANTLSTTAVKQIANVTQPPTRSKDSILKKAKHLNEKNSVKKIKVSESTSNDEELKAFSEKKAKATPKAKTRHKSNSSRRTKESFDKVDEKLQRVEEMLHDEVLKGTRKPTSYGRLTKAPSDAKSQMKSNVTEKMSGDLPTVKKSTPSNSMIRQEMLTAMTGLNGSVGLGMRAGSFPYTRKNHATAAVIANALLAARNANIFTY